MTMTIRVGTGPKSSFKEFICYGAKKDKTCSVCRLRFKCWTSREDEEFISVSELGVNSINYVNINVIKVFLLEEGINNEKNCEKKRTNTAKKI